MSTEKTLIKIRKVIGRIRQIFGNVEKMIQTYRTEVLHKMDDDKLKANILKALETLIKIEQQEAKAEKDINAARFITYQKKQLNFLDILEHAVNELENKPSLESDIQNLIAKLEASLEEEIARFSQRAA